MTPSDWRGVMPAITTPFRGDLSIDHEFLGKHAAWMIDAGCTGIVTPGSLGEGATLSREERSAVWRTCVEAVGSRVPVIAAIASASTLDAVAQAREAHDRGCRGLMVLPPYVYKGSWREIKHHFEAIFRATPLSCMLYNNPIAYGTDVTPEQLAELAAEHPNLHAVKKSSADVRRMTAIRALLGDRVAMFVGVDDLIVEGLGAGAVGWIAGLVNAFPRESVSLFEAARRGERERAQAMYEWFLPLLRMDVVTEFVQLIKLAQARVGMGNTRVRPPRLELPDDAAAHADAIIAMALASRGTVGW